MNLTTAKTLAGSCAGLSGSTGISTVVMAYLQSNAAGIGALCTIITLICYIFFQRLATKKATLSDKNKEDIDHHSQKLTDHISETKRGFEKVDNGIASILEKLN